MGIEIERKFLIQRGWTGWREAGAPARIAQGYLQRDPARTVRVRQAGGKGFLTVKGRTQGISRLEFEYEIPAADAKALLALCPRVLEKDRYRVPFGGRVWEVDIFHGANEGLRLAEVEIPRADAPLAVPPWAGEEVTADARYYNSQLVDKPFSTWKEAST